MKALLVVTMISGLWVLLMFGSARAVTTVSFDVGSASISKYVTFIDSLRNAVKDASLRCYGIPMLPPTTQEPKYVLAKLEASGKSITLMFRRNNLYIMGYSDLLDGKCRYHIFNDVTGTDRTDAEDTLCPDKTNRVAKNINYSSRYPSIESKIGNNIDRSQVDIGITILASSIGKISGVNTYTEKTEAEFLLAAIQMTAEAARFKYIENQVTTNFNRNFRPNTKVIALEETWGKISTAIHAARNGVISPPLSLKGPNNEAWTVIRVDEIKPDISLLNYNSGTCQLNILIPAIDDIMSY